MEKILLIPNLNKDPSLEFTKEVVKEVLKYEKTVILSEELKSILSLEEVKYLPEKDLFKEADLVVPLGGDGTILSASKNAAFYSVPVMGINIGHLGFLTQAERGDLSVFGEVFSGNYEITESMLLDVSVISEEKVIKNYLAFNDAVIRGSYSKMVTLSISIDNTGMNEFVADGAIFSTATGSTAYSMSAGGPIVHPKLKCMIVTPICPHTLNLRSVVVPPESEICAKTVPPYRCDAMLTVDGEKVHTLKKDDYVIVKKSDMATKLLSVPEKNFFDVVRQKLNIR